MLVKYLERFPFQEWECMRFPFQEWEWMRFPFQEWDWKLGSKVYLLEGYVQKPCPSHASSRSIKGTIHPYLLYPFNYFHETWVKYLHIGDDVQKSCGNHTKLKVMVAIKDPFTLLYPLENFYKTWVKCSPH